MLHEALCPLADRTRAPPDDAGDQNQLTPRWAIASRKPISCTGRIDLHFCGRARLSRLDAAADRRIYKFANRRKFGGGTSAPQNPQPAEAGGASSAQCTGAVHGPFRVIQRRVVGVLGVRCPLG
jgi:hypothetical protein